MASFAVSSIDAGRKVVSFVVAAFGICARLLTRRRRKKGGRDSFRIVMPRIRKPRRRQASTRVLRAFGVSYKRLNIA